MISNILFIVGIGVFSAALRSFHHPLLFRIGTVGVLATSFLAGWLIGGSIILGVLLAVSWLFLPWLEILTRVRTMRLPAERKLETMRPPTRTAFPGFNALSDQVEEMGFEHVRDLGWDFDGMRHFYRIFHHPERRLQACICLSEQREFAFFYLTMSSRLVDGDVLTTWNYPFSYGLKFQPRTKLNRVAGEASFSQMATAHEKFLHDKGVLTENILNPDAGEIVLSMQEDMSSQIRHNITEGLLRRDGADMIRYTVRGMFYLWFQFLRDCVRLS